MTPLSQDRADRLVRFLATDGDGIVLDIGGGWAELLLPVIGASPHAPGIGVDLDVAAAEHGRALARERGSSDRVALLTQDAKTRAPECSDAVMHRCQSDLRTAGRSQPTTGLRERPDCYAAMVEGGAHVVFGEGAWSRPPTVKAVTPLSGRPDELVYLVAASS